LHNQLAKACTAKANLSADSQTLKSLSHYLGGQEWPKKQMAVQTNYWQEQQESLFSRAEKCSCFSGATRRDEFLS